jgi:hypothetical protein
MMDNVLKMAGYSEALNAALKGDSDAQCFLGTGTDNLGGVN